MVDEGGRTPARASPTSRGDVAAELADGAITALVAIESLGFDTRQVVADCAGKVTARQTPG